MGLQGGPVGPLFNKHQPQRLLGILMHTMRMQPGSARERATCAWLNSSACARLSALATTLPSTRINVALQLGG